MMKIAIHSVPRSGSTWLGSIFDSHPNVLYKYQPLFSYRLKGFLTPKSSLKDINTFFEILEKIEDNFIDQKEAKEKGIIPTFEKEEITTIVYKEVRYNNIIENMVKKNPEIKVVGIIRNPLAVLSSWYNAPREFRKDLGWNFENEWKYADLKNQNKPEEFFGFDKWKQVAKLFEKLNKEYPARFFLLEYKDLLNNTIETVKTLFEFSGLKFDLQVKNFIEISKKKHIDNTYSVFKIKKDDKKWENVLPKSIVKQVLEDLRDSTLEKYLIEGK